MSVWIVIIASIAAVVLLLQRFTKMEFVSHARILFKAWSVWLSTAGATLMVFLMSAPDTLLSAWNSLPDEIKSLIPPQWLSYIGPGLVMLGVASQFIRQRKLLEEKRQLERRL
ncbi:hypothetical protein [Pseudescherichia sp.]|uniref:DUF7940 domain-containing protein n=1 Tax=Pseudescherichia sp. TaxID=2055881 RepID=UPI00289CCA40|nr:hypothetical protein [Pseudescherichia sp.]